MLPLYTCLDGDILTPANKFAYYEVGLKCGVWASADGTEQRGAGWPDA